MPTTTARNTSGKVTVRMDDKDIKAILRAFSKMDKQANQDLRDLSREIASDLVGEFRNAARGTRWYPQQASFVAQSARVARDRTPAVTLGGEEVPQVVPVVRCGAGSHGDVYAASSEAAGRVGRGMSPCRNCGKPVSDRVHDVRSPSWTPVRFAAS